MADFTAYRIPLLSESYPVVYDAFVTELQTRATEVENAREGQASLLINMQRKITASDGLTQDLNANGFRFFGAVTPVAVDELVTKGYADGLAFGSALPGISADTDGLGVTNDGATASWGESAADATANFGNWFNGF